MVYVYWLYPLAGHHRQMPMREQPTKPSSRNLPNSDIEAVRLNVKYIEMILNKA
jgi:hypothetical protein